MYKYGQPVEGFSTPTTGACIPETSNPMHPHAKCGRAVLYPPQSSSRQANQLLDRTVSRRDIAGSDYAGSTAAKASRVLFAHTSEGRSPSGKCRHSQTVLKPLKARLGSGLFRAILMIFVCVGPQRLQCEGFTRAEHVDCSPLDRAQQARNCLSPPLRQVDAPCQYLNNEILLWHSCDSSLQ